jgi:hypothetical protein
MLGDCHASPIGLRGIACHRHHRGLPARPGRSWPSPAIRAWPKSGSSGQTSRELRPDMSSPTVLALGVEGNGSALPSWAKEGQMERRSLPEGVSTQGSSSKSAVHSEVPMAGLDSEIHGTRSTTLSTSSPRIRRRPRSPSEPIDD